MMKKFLILSLCMVILFMFLLSACAENISFAEGDRLKQNTKIPETTNNETKNITGTIEKDNKKTVDESQLTEETNDNKTIVTDIRNSERNSKTKNTPKETVKPSVNNTTMLKSTTSISKSSTQTIISGDVKFEVTTDKSVYYLGDIICVAVKAINISDKDIYMYDTSFPYSLRQGLIFSVGSNEYEFSFPWYPDKNPVRYRGIFSAILKPGESVEIKNQNISSFDTTQPSGSGWKTEFMENIPPIYINIQFNHLTSMYNVNNPIDKAEPYKCTVPIIIKAVEIDWQLKQLLEKIYEPDLITKILFSKDTDKIHVDIKFEDFKTANEYIALYMGGNSSNALQVYELRNGSIDFKIPCNKLIEMAQNNFKFKVKLF